MPDLDDYADTAEELIDWFRSQRVRPEHAVTTMCIVIGAMAAQLGNTKADAMHGCEMAEKAIASDAFDRRQQS